MTPELEMAIRKAAIAGVPNLIEAWVKLATAIVNAMTGHIERGEYEKAGELGSQLAGVYSQIAQAVITVRQSLMLDNDGHDIISHNHGNQRRGRGRKHQQNGGDGHENRRRVVSGDQHDNGHGH